MKFCNVKKDLKEYYWFFYVKLCFSANAPINYQIYVFWNRYFFFTLLRTYYVLNWNCLYNENCKLIRRYIIAINENTTVLKKQCAQKIFDFQVKSKWIYNISKWKFILQSRILHTSENFLNVNCFYERKSLIIFFFISLHSSLLLYIFTKVKYFSWRWN